MNKPITFQNSISNEEAALLPAIEFRGPIVVVDSEPRLREACRYLAAQPVIGFDTETRPSFRAGVVNRVALLQLSSPEQSFLFRLCKIPLDKAIVKILENKGDPENRRRCKGRPAGTAQHPALSGSGLRGSSGARRRVGHRREKPAQTFGDRTRPAGIQSSAPEQLGSRTTHRQAAALRRNGRLGLHAYLRPAAAHPNQRKRRNDPANTPPTRQGRVVAAPPSLDFLGRDRIRPLRRKRNPRRCPRRCLYPFGRLHRPGTLPDRFDRRAGAHLRTGTDRRGLVAADDLHRTRRAPHAQAHGCPRHHLLPSGSRRGDSCRDSSSIFTTRPP